MKKQEELIKEKIENIISEFEGYGYRRVTKELQRQGMKINHKKVKRIMKENNLLMKKKKRFVVTTDSTHQFHIYPNLLKELIITGINQVWVADITYIRVGDKFIYLAVIMDLYSRKIIGWNIREDLTEELALSALRMALKDRIIPKELIHHSDRGVHYAAISYTNLLKQNSIQISMSRKGNCYDNAAMESFFKTLKREEVNLNDYETVEEAKTRIEYFIEQIYNTRRLHSSIGYKSPINFENSIIASLSVT
jgi:transposase InsO family protein